MLHGSAAYTVRNTWSAFTTGERLFLAAGCLLCILIFVGLGKLLDVPQIPRMEGSLLAGHSPVISVIIVAIATLACASIGAVIAGYLELDGGLFCVTVGLAAAAVRGGPMRLVLQFAASPSVFLLLAVELFLLFALLAGAWIVLNKIFQHLWSAKLKPPISPAGSEHPSDAPEIKDIILAVVVQAAVMSFCELVFLQSGAKKQVMSGVAVSAFLGTLAAYQIAPLASGIFYWLGPMVVGVIGYVAAYAAAGSQPPQGWLIGDPTGTLAALARALPLDYASVGTAGAILGFWTSRRWAMGEEQPPVKEQPAATAT